MDLIIVLIILMFSILVLARMNWPFFFSILRECSHPQVLNLRDDKEGKLYFEASVKSTIISGVPGSGKTIYAVQQVAQLALENPECTIVSLEIAGAFKKEMIKYALSAKGGGDLLKRFVVDELCRKDAVKPMPEFSLEYGVPMEDQVQRLSTNLKHLHSRAVEINPTVASAFDDPTRELSRLLIAIRDDHGDCFQITEGKELLIDPDKNKLAVDQFGQYAPSARRFFEREIWAKDVSAHDRHMMTLALRNALSDIDTREARATLGYPDPAYTFAKAIEKHQIVMISGENLLNQRAVMGYMMVQRFSLLMQEINKRKANGNYPLVIIVIDELPWLLKATGLSDEVGDLHSFYRSRGVGVIVIIQNHSQLSKELLDKIWNFGNVVTFADENFEEATDIVKNLMTYNPTFPKYPIPVPGKEDTYQGQTAAVANFVMNLKARECLVKRYKNQQLKDPYVRHVRRTKDLPPAPSEENVMEMCEKLALEGTVSVREGLSIVGQRKLHASTSPTPGTSDRRGA